MFRETGHMEEMQEAHFYHEEPSEVNASSIYEKSNLHLQLHMNTNISTQNQRLGQLRKNNIPAEISSPDFGILKLASPDLEKMLIAFQTGGNETRGGSSAIVVPHEHVNNPTSKGLPEVLQELHDRQDTHGLKGIIPPMNTGGTLITDETMNSSDQLYLTTDANGIITVAGAREKFNSSAQTFCTITAQNNTEKQTQNQTYVLPSYPTNTLLPNNQIYTTPLRHPTEDHEAVNQLHALTAYNNVLATTNSAFPAQLYKLDGSSVFGGDNNSIQPIDLEMQEMVKRERKKQRNRVASSKCRKRKLEKEAVLESTVRDLKARNVELSTLANALKQQICDLKQKVMDHVSEGCPIALTNVEEDDDVYSDGDWGTFSERT